MAKKTDASGETHYQISTRYEREFVEGDLIRVRQFLAQSADEPLDGRSVTNPELVKEATAIRELVTLGIEAFKKKNPAAARSHVRFDRDGNSLRGKSAKTAKSAPKAAKSAKTKTSKKTRMKLTKKAAAA